MDSELASTAPSGHLSETEVVLLRAFTNGDGMAFHALMRPHLSSLLSAARRMTNDWHWAEDLLQEALVRAYQGLAQFRGEASLRTWLLRILVRLAVEPRRWRRGEKAKPLPTEIPDTLPPQQDVATRELQDRMAEAMERLPTRQRLALHLRAVEGMDYSAIAQVLHCSNGAARMLVLSARQSISQRLGGYLEP